MKKLIVLLLVSLSTGSTFAAKQIASEEFQDRVIPGYYFKVCENRCDGKYQPMYQHPRFRLYNHSRPYIKDCNCRDILVNNHTGKHGMVRCYNHEGLSIEYFYR